MRRPAHALRRLSRAVLSPTGPTRDRALGLSERMGALTTLNSSLEYLAQRRQTESGGLNDWTVLRDVRRGTHPLLARVLEAVSGPRTTTVVHTGRAAVAVALLAPGRGRWRGAAQLALAVSGTLLQPRHIFGGDGSDQVSAVVQGATGAARLVRTDAAKDALIWYVATQANLSYAVSGWVKLLGPRWRDGSALPGVMRTRTYGHPGMWAWTQRHPQASRLLTHAVLALECGFPLLYAFGGRLARPAIAAAVLFHGANAHLMGLGRFFTAFTSMHPLVAYTAAPRSHPVGAHRDDRVLPLTAAALTAAAAIASVAVLRTRLTTADGAPGVRTTIAGSGNLLQYERHAEGAPGRPVVVFETGMCATPEHFAWITDRLADTTDLGVLSYARAGYNGSHRRAGGAYTLQESVADLADLIRAQVPDGRPVVLAGHSLGGEIARRAAPLLADRLLGVVYLDSSHPAELLRSAQQSRTAAAMGESLSQMAWFLRLGGGILMARPEWLGDLPRRTRRRARAQYADGRLWWAARREWAATEREFRDHSGELPPVPGRALVISAQRTVDNDPAQLLLHRELARAHTGGGDTVVLEGADHSDMLTHAGHALEIARRIAAFAAAEVPAPREEIRR
ncbi:alpha/beta fold hydrolase [Streptomyces sp. NPDC000594]|uniref:alpha/beta fold hydrolase n=1 Tax=Streptomyces sp. NPDC000594 TaxID=3154261 RepID=UPI0033346013